MLCYTDTRKGGIGERSMYGHAKIQKPETVLSQMFAHHPTHPSLSRHLLLTLLRLEELQLPTSSFTNNQELRSEQMFEKEIEAYLLMEKELLRNPKYVNKYVALHSGEIVDYDSDRIALADRVYAKYGYIPILIKKVETERYTRFYSSRRPR